MIKTIFILVAAIAIVAGRPESKILGGRNAALGEIPYQASLQYWGTTFHFASGVLLNSRWVVTTAQGVFGRAGNSVNIILGIVRRDVTFTNRQSMEIRIHPMFDFNTRHNDIAVIRSAAVIAFTTTISPATISPLFFDIGVVADVSGWGSTREDMTNEAVILQRASVTTVACPASDFITFNPMQHICAGTPVNSTAPTVGICTIDVGGPVMADNMLIAIPFFHDPRFCGRSPDGYLRMSFYRPWIMGNIPLP
ncbi:unnamed protein product [Chironomus riparius]|uniref:Peptidase S1 domain-containing protein n=1 Tax=Chironomus riparius TaxID=315576 RepID=A0A9N9S9N1_9DIPT|nr:unnamed protein product [Chironomus riparius]